MSKFKHMTAIQFEMWYVVSQLSDFDTFQHCAGIDECCEELFNSVNNLRLALCDGTWNVAKKLIRSLGLKQRAIDELNFQIALELYWSQGLSDKLIQFVKTNIKTPEYITDIATILLQDDNQRPRRNRESLFWEVVSDPDIKSRLQKILDSALQFKEIIAFGKVSKNIKAVDVQSYVYSDLYLRHLHNNSKINCFQKLEFLCEKVSIVNVFNIEDVSENLVQLLCECLRADIFRTVTLLQRNDDFCESLQNHLEFSPLSEYKHFKKKFGFNYLKEYDLRNDGSLPHVSDVLELGTVMQRVLDPYAVWFDANESILNQFSYESLTEFPLVPKYRVDLGTSIWSLACSHDLKYVVAGISGVGTVGIFHSNAFASLELKKTLPKGKPSEQLTFGQNNDRLLICRGGSVTTVSCASRFSTHKVGSVPSSDVYGSICWHPEDKNYFFTTTDSEKALKMIHYVRKVIIRKWEIPYFPLIITSSESHILILTVKTAGKPQHLLQINYNTSEMKDIELPSLALDGTYTALQTSHWERRLIMLLGSPNCIFLIDKYGEWKTRVFYGTKTGSCLLKARFGGPMDKFIITSTESSKNPGAIIFNRFTGKLITVLKGHDKQVNDVIWIQPEVTKPATVLSASDDGSFIVYS